MRWRSLMVFAVAALTLVLNAEALGRLVRSGFRMASSWKSGFCTMGETIDAPRRMASYAKANGKSIAFCRSREEGILPIERSRILAMSWAMSPDPIRNGPVREIKDADAIVAIENEPFIAAELREHGFSIRQSSGGVDLWCKGDGWEMQPEKVRQKWFTESVALASVIAFLVCCCFLYACEGAALGLTGLSVLVFILGGMMGFAHYEMSLAVAALAVLCLLLWKRHALSIGLKPMPFILTKRQTVAATVLLTGYSLLALTHTFVAPNGLGTVGGKAKLLFLAGGIPDDFFVNPAFSVYQPAYPPGAASIVLWSNLLVSFCGEWIMQLLPCVLMAACAGYLMSRLKSGLGTAMVFVAFITPLSIRLATLFYPEVYVAICCLIGWERIRRNNLDSVGWLLMGASGWFKNEGLVYFGAMAMAVIILHPPVRYRRLFSRIAVGLVLPAVWHLGCRLAGASLDGYLPPGQFCAHQFWAATCRMLQYMFCSPWQYAFLFPMALFSLLVNRRDNGNLKTLTVFVLFGVAAFSVIFSMSAAVDFDWHLKSAERLLWVPSLLLLREIAWLGSRDETV